jgi:hypothetical protein
MLFHLDKNVTRQSLEHFPFSEYAAEHWFKHARFEGVSQHVLEGMKKLFDRTKPYLSIWLWIHDPTAPLWKRRDSDAGPSTPCGTPLHYAAFCGLYNIAKILATEHPQDVYSQSVDEGSSRLHRASRRGHVDLGGMLKERGADVSARNKVGWTALHLACLKGHVDLARMLIDRGADVSARNEYGSTALHLALNNGHVDLGRMLIDRGADVSAQNHYGWTALHLAFENGHVDFARMLESRESSTSLAPHVTPQITTTT